MEEDFNNYDSEYFEEDSETSENTEYLDNDIVVDNELKESLLSNNQEEKYDDSLLDRIVQLFAYVFLIGLLIKIISWIF